MSYLILSLLICLFSDLASAVRVLQAKEIAEPQRLESRKLSAASKHSGIQARSDSFTLSNEVEFLYAEDNYNGPEGSTMAATIRLGSNNPILVLEDIEHLLYNIECTFGSIKISTSDSMEENMCKQLHSLEGGHIITSHITCNDATGRQAYKILSTSQSTHSTITLDILPVSWKDKDSFTSLSVSLGHQPTATYNVRSHALTSDAPDLSKRQGTAYDSSNFSFNIAPTISSFPSAPSSPPQRNSHSFDLSTLGPFINTQYPLNLPGSLDPAPIAVGCANCTLWGTMSVEFANFDYDLSEESVSGTATMQAKGVGAHMFLATNLTDTWYFTFPLKALTYALEISSFGEIEFGVGVFVAGGYDMQGSVGMRYGFDMTVPESSSLMLNVGDPTSSNMVGFQHTHFTALPFESHATIQALDLWLSLRTAITAKLSVEGKTLGDAGAYVDVPRLNAKVTPVSNVDENCVPLSNSNTDNGQEDREILTDVIQVDVYGSLDYGAYARLEYVNIDVPSYMCLNFDQETQSYSTAKQAVEGRAASLSVPSSSMLALTLVFVMIVLL